MLLEGAEFAVHRIPASARRGGPPLPEAECEVVDVETGEAMGPRDEGEIPKSAPGKILRRVLIERERSGTPG